MTQIVGFSGKKQSGKNTACNFIVGHSMLSLGIIRHGFKLNTKGQLHISDLFGDTAYEGIFDVTRNNKAMKEFLKEHLDEWLKIYSFADILKTEVCMNILGLTYEQCYGSDEDKNTQTHLRWEDMPGVVTPDSIKKELHDSLMGLTLHDPGSMTAREVMQYVGTELFRKMYGDVWVDALLRKINNDGPGIALISDVRFPNEVFGLQRSGGVVVRFTRNNDSPDKHPSETSLDKEVFDWDNFNHIIDNKDMSIEEQNKEVYSLMYSLGLFHEEENDN